MSKYKIINDPVHGFITITDPLVFQIIEHNCFQRLRRISQMGLANYVYPGTQHTRFHHALGAMHLMQEAISTLKLKDVAITAEEEQAALCAILLHDIGHGPYSHTLEYVMTGDVHHEFLSLLIMQQLNNEFNGKLDLAIKIFKGEYEKEFLHQLVSSQLDVDRLDYLARDSFFSGVYEGRISTERIINMLNVVDNQLVVEEKGLYSIEKYIISRRLMYWQVYLHKAAIGAEQILVNIIKRAKYLVQNKQLTVPSSPLNYFLQQNFTKNDFIKNPELLNQYTLLDDFDVMLSIKEWTTCNDRILAYLSKCIINRSLFKIKIKDKEFATEDISLKRKKIANEFGLTEQEAEYLVLTGEITNTAYSRQQNGIQILTKSGKVKDVAKVSEQLRGKILRKTVKKYYFAYPKHADERQATLH